MPIFSTAVEALAVKEMLVTILTTLPTALPNPLTRVGPVTEGPLAPLTAAIVKVAVPDVPGVNATFPVKERLPVL
jgi:hypothetical protein